MNHLCLSCAFRDLIVCQCLEEKVRLGALDENDTIQQESSHDFLFLFVPLFQLMDH